MTTPNPRELPPTTSTPLTPGKRYTFIIIIIINIIEQHHQQIRMEMVVVYMATLQVETIQEVGFC